MTGNEHRELDSLKELMETKLKGLLTIIESNHVIVINKFENVEQKNEKIDRRVDEMSKTIQSIMIENNNKCSVCLNTKKIPELVEKIDKNKYDLETQIKDLSDKTSDLRFYNRHPRILVGAIAVCVIFVLVGYANVMSKFSTMESTFMKKEYYRDPSETQVFRGGSVNIQKKNESKDDIKIK